MVYKTLSQITNNVITRLGLHKSPTGLVLTTNKIHLAVHDTFALIYRKRYWKELSTWVTGTLDGTYGVVTADLSNTILSYKDIAVVYYEDDENPLPELDKFTSYNLIGTGTRAKCILPSSSAGKFFQVLPATSTGNVYFYVRTYPDEAKNTPWTGEFLADTIIPFDSITVELGTAYLIATDDSIKENFRSLFNSRLKQLEDEEETHPKQILKNPSSILSEWT